MKLKELDVDYISELLEKAEKMEVKKELPKIKKHLHRFIDELNIKDGDDKVPTYLIYYTYRIKWTNCKNDYKMSKIGFFRQFNKLFKSYRLGKQRYYLLDKSSFDFSRENLMEADYYERRYQKTKNKKIKNKTSKSRQKV